MNAPALTADDVSIALAGRPVVRRANLRVSAGEFVVVLGTNGSGKSTLIRGCVGLAPLASGRVELFGTPVGSLREWWRVGYVPQRSSASSGVPATVREVVATGALARRRFVGWPNRRDRRAVSAALDQVGLSDLGTDSVAELSGGQQQRVMIARALVGGPDLLVLDEPTAGVDATTQTVLAELLGDLVTRGVAVLLVAHDLGPMGRLVDRAVVLRDGRVAYTGPVTAVPPDLGSLAHDHPHTSRPVREGGVPASGAWR